VAISQNNIALDVPGVYMWRTTFDGNNYGQGAAIGIFMLVTVAVLIIPYMIYSMRSEPDV
jgi:glucose/mannose transport system permease protein